MKQNIEFKKDCMLSSKAEEITEIEITNDYKVLDNEVEGHFNLVGKLKYSKTSIYDEDFSFTIPFTIALNPSIIKESIDLKIDDFDYLLDSDVLKVTINMLMNYEKEEEKIVEEIIDDIPLYKEEEKEESPLEEVVNDLETNDEVFKYKVYVVKSEDTLESIAIKYNVSVEDIKSYNENVSEGVKLIIPIYEN